MSLTEERIVVLAGMIQITAEVRAAIDRAAGDMEFAGDEYIEMCNKYKHVLHCHQGH